MNCWLWLFGASVAAAPAWPLCVEWLRHRPHNPGRGTQPLVLAGLAGWLLFLALALWALAGVREAARAQEARHTQSNRAAV